MNPTAIRKTSKFMKGAFILTLAAIITKVLSALYRIPFQNIVGDVGFYIYQQVYPFYGIAVSLATYGFPVIISKLYADKIANKDINGARTVLGTSFLTLLLFNGFIFIFIYTLSESIAAAMGDIKLAPLLKIVSISFLFIPIIASIRGYFQGIGNMLPTAISQVGEQLVRVLAIIGFSILLIQSGSNLYEVGGGAIFASILGGFVAILILIMFIWKLKHMKTWNFSLLKMKFSFRVLKVLLTDGIAVCISGMILIMFQLIDALQLYSLLVEHGLDEDKAKEIKGIFDRGQPILQVGTVLATSLSLSLVPFISAAKNKGNLEDIKPYIHLSYRVSFTIGAAASVGLILIMNPLNTMLFQNDDGSTVLSILSLSIIFSSIILTISAVLQGLGNIYFPALAIIIGIGIKYLFNYWFIREWNTAGAALATVISLFFISLILIWKIKSTLGEFILEKRFFSRLLTAMVVMILVVYGQLSIFQYVYGTDSRLLSSIQAMISALVGGFIYIYVIIRGKMFNKVELSMLPLGNKLVRFLPKKEKGGL